MFCSSRIPSVVVKCLDELPLSYAGDETLADFGSTAGAIGAWLRNIWQNVDGAPWQGCRAYDSLSVYAQGAPTEPAWTARRI